VPGYISATPVAAAVAGLDKEAQAKITTDVRDALPPTALAMASLHQSKLMWQ
jgi:hypothetical protein